MTSVSPGLNVTINENGVESTIAGIFNWTLNSVNGIAAPANSTFTTFCIEIHEFVYYNTPSTYNLTTDIFAVPNGGVGAGFGDGIHPPDGAMGPSKAALLQQLFDQYYASATTSTGNAAQDQINAAAFQLAVWEIVHDALPSGAYTDHALTDGEFWVYDPGSGSVHDAIGLGDSWLHNLNGASTAAHVSLIALTGPNLQDQITVHTVAFDQGVATPAPKGLILGLTGAIGLFGFGVYSRRRGALSVA